MSELRFTPEEVTEAVAKVTEEDRYAVSGERYMFSTDEGESVSWTDLHWTGHQPVETAIGTVKVVEAEGGGEGDGEHAHLVIQTVATGQYFRIDGYYQSYDGLYLDGDLREVQAQTKTVVFYE